MKNVHVLCDISLVRSRLDTCFYVIDFFFPALTSSAWACLLALYNFPSHFERMCVVLLAIYVLHGIKLDIAKLWLHYRLFPT